MAAHAMVCQEVAPWRRREVARNTGRKCEKPRWPKAYGAMQAAATAKRKEPLP